MKTFLYLSVLLQLLFDLNVVGAGPITISNGDDIAEDVEIDDEFTTQTVERLSSAATCLVASVEYTHGQQIYRADPCEFCLCLDGEMFCWWQDCPPTLEGPCKDKRPFTSCQASESENAIYSDPQPHPQAPVAQPRREISDSGTIASASNSTTIATSSATLPSQIATVSSSASHTVIGDTNEYNNSNIGQEDTSAVVSAAMGSLMNMDVTTDTPKRCSIMGRLYNIGDRLPHTTGNCVECICGAGAQIVCSPHQCAPSVDDINDYRPAGLRSGQPDVF